MTNGKSTAGNAKLLPVRVKTAKTQFVLIALTGLFFVPIGLFNLSRALTSGFSFVPTLLALIVFAAFAPVVFLFVRALRRMPKVFDHKGVTRRDGQHFNWSQLVRVEHQYQLSKYSPNRKSFWRIEVQFQEGTIWLIPLKIKNFSEVYRLVIALPCEQTEKICGSNSF